jgi:hypothetical protein
MEEFALHAAHAWDRMNAIGVSAGACFMESSMPPRSEVVLDAGAHGADRFGRGKRTVS